VSRLDATLAARYRDELQLQLADLPRRVTTSVPVAPGDRVSFGSVTYVVTDRPVAARVSGAGP
jgi:hypothetical protein